MVDPKLRLWNPSFEPVHRVTGVLSTGARRAMHSRHPERLEDVVTADTRPSRGGGGGVVSSPCVSGTRLKSDTTPSESNTTRYDRCVDATQRGSTRRVHEVSRIHCNSERVIVRNYL